MLIPGSHKYENQYIIEQLWVNPFKLKLKLINTIEKLKLSLFMTTETKIESDQLQKSDAEFCI